MQTWPVIVVNLPFEDSGGELTTLAMKAKWTLAYAKVPPMAVPANLRLVIFLIAHLPTSFGCDFRFNGRKTARNSYYGLRLRFPCLSSTSEVATFGGGLSLFAVKPSLSRHPSLAISCGCPLARRDMLICGSPATFCHKIGPGSNVLLHSANEVWGVTADNPFRTGFC
ncbi:MAG: hypothetical protein ACTS46_01150 [Candidatus Hodgkinia cicadicola]